MEADARRVARRTHGVSLEHRVGGCVRYYCRGGERTVVPLVEVLQIAAGAGDRVDRQLRLARLVVVQLALTPNLTSPLHCSAQYIQ